MRKKLHLILLVLFTAFNASHAQISGFAFRDFNADGVKNSNETIGIQGVKVFLYANNGALIDSAVTTSTGQYSFVVAPSSNKLKIQFDKLSFPLNAKESFFGVNNGTDIQFVTAPNTAVNIGLNLEGDYCGQNPKIVTPIFIDGASGTNTTGLNDALYSLNYSNYGAKTTEATRAETGSVWGVAYSKKTKQLYTASFLKRHVG
ncbi:MAG: hypothetical protein KA198_03310, partial [Chitinophagaceae bacterium]|nr:hypothetical protein [Chitinophagaceae bacterium]